MIYMSLIYVFLLVGPAIATIAFSRRLSTRWYWFLLSLCVCYGISPLLVTWGAFGLAKHDAYMLGEGSLHASLLGLFTVADVRGTPENAQGELLRFFAEMLWYPTALLPSQGVRWEAIDSPLFCSLAAPRYGDLLDRSWDSVAVNLAMFELI